jgi:flagellar motor switch protein FliN/FliY
MDDINEPPNGTPRSASLLQQIPIEVIVCVGKARPRVRDLLAMSENAVLPLDRRIDDPVELYIGDRLVARGELQEMDGAQAGQLAVRLTEVINDPSEIG